MVKFNNRGEVKGGGNLEKVEESSEGKTGRVRQAGDKGSQMTKEGPSWCRWWKSLVLFACWFCKR